MICPVCGKSAVKEYSDYLDYYLLMEEAYHCGEHYFYQYMTGYTQETIGKYTFYWSYNKALNWFDQLRRRIVIALMKKKLL